MTMVDNFDVVQNAPTNQRIPSKGDMLHVIPRFFEVTNKTDRIDADTGLPIFHTVEYVELLIAGDKGNAPVKRVNEGIKQQFHEQYAFWKSKKVNSDMIGDGVPLSLWPVVPAEMVKALEYINVFTVQQLAALNDANISKPGAIGLREMRDKARNFIESAKTMAPIVKLEAENGELKKRLELMQEQMKQLMERVDSTVSVAAGLPSATVADLLPAATKTEKTRDSVPIKNKYQNRNKEE